MYVHWSHTNQYWDVDIVSDGTIANVFSLVSGIYVVILTLLKTFYWARHHKQSHIGQNQSLAGLILENGEF